MKKLLSIVLSVMILLASCDSDKESKQDPKPVLPPEFSMAPNLNDFSTNDAQRNATSGNWVYSALNVGVYSAILTVGLAIPVSAFTAITSQEPTYNTEAGVWAWENSFSANANDFSLLLTADVDGDNVKWTGSVSSSKDDIQDFVWFEGQSNLNGTNGSWSLFESPKNPTVWMSTQWAQNDDSSVAEATFTIEKEGASSNSYIKYMKNENDDFNRAVEISNTDSGDLIEIDWNNELKFGRVKSQNYFNDAAFHCWNENLQDVSCD